MYDNYTFDSLEEWSRHNQYTQWIGYVWLLIAILNIPTALFIHRIAIITVVIQFLVAELWLGKIRKLIIFAHTEIHFYKAAKKRRKGYLLFRRMVKAGNNDNFEENARGIIN